MYLVPRAFIALGLLLGLFAAPLAAAPPPQRPLVILVSVDGLRADYLDRGVTPNIAALAAAGVRGAMRPSFPSLTFPNHYTLVTGLRPDDHGIVGNTMFDSDIPGVRFSLGNHDAVVDRRWWDEAEPIWVTAEKAGLRTGTMFWPGSEAEIHGVRPTRWQAFDGKLPAAARVDVLFGWLDDPAPIRPVFLTLYFDDVDHAGHEAGPDGAAVNTALVTVDRAIRRLVRGLKDRGIAANIILVADHGMAATSPARVIPMAALAPATTYRLVTAGPYAGLDPLAGQDTALATALLHPHAHAECWRRQDIPKRFEYGRNPRVPAFLCLAETGWLILPDDAPPPVAGGAHGYDNAAPEMLATFIASGPTIKPGAALPVFDNVDVYPLVMALIGVSALPSDGSETLLPLLR